MSERHAQGRGSACDQTVTVNDPWAPFAVAALGLWLASGPYTFGYESAAMTVNDIVAGVLLIVLGLLSIKAGRAWSRWGAAIVGLWLLFAPLSFWAPDQAAYVNNTLVGVLAISFALIIPGIPGARPDTGADIPPGWSFNPSSWVQRAPIIGLALISFFFARYLTTYHLGYIDTAWDPFFGDGTEQVLESEISEAFPISDAGLGAVVYLLEALSGFLGGRNRWRTMPWAVVLFGILVIPLGITSIVLIILQPVAVGAWCTFCLITALLMLIMIPLAVPEVIAMGQFVAQSRRQGRPIVDTLRYGDTNDDGEQEHEPVTFQSPPRLIAVEMVRGVNIPWNLALSVLLGLWLMASPEVLAAEGWAANSNYLAGPLVVLVSMIALAEVIRPVRFVNVLFGVWIVATPWVLAGATTELIWSNLAAGVALIFLSFPRGRVYEPYGSWSQRIR